MPIPAPTRLTSLPISAYSTSLALDGDTIYLMTSNAAFRLVEGEPAHGIHLELGVGPAISRSAFVFWSNGVIWSVPKQGGDPRQLAKFPHQPQYFVAAGETVAWLDQSEEGVYTIHTLDGRETRALLSSNGELRGMTMIDDALYFVQRPQPTTWRIGVIPLGGAEPHYGPPHKGRAPSQLTGTTSVYYYDLDRQQIIKVSPDLAHEETELADVVCSPIHASNRVYCGSVEGLFEVSDRTHRPRVLAANRPGSITSVISSDKRVVWTVDLGADQLAVDSLPASDDP